MDLIGNNRVHEHVAGAAEFNFGLGEIERPRAAVDGSFGSGKKAGSVELDALFRRHARDAHLTGAVVDDAAVLDEEHHAVTGQVRVSVDVEGRLEGLAPPFSRM